MPSARGDGNPADVARRIGNDCASGAWAMAGMATVSLSVLSAYAPARDGDLHATVVGMPQRAGMAVAQGQGLHVGEQTLPGARGMAVCASHTCHLPVASTLPGARGWQPCPRDAAHAPARGRRRRLTLPPDAQAPRPPVREAAGPVFCVFRAAVLK